MKRYTDLTTEELSELTSDEIQRFIDIEVAHAGIQIVSKPLPLEATFPKLESNVTAYSVKGVVVKTMEDAQVIQNLTIYSEKYEWPNYTHKFLKEVTESDISIKQFYTQEQVKQVATQAEAYKKAEEAYKEANKVYCEYQQQIDSFKTEVMDAISEARNVMYRRQQAQAAYDRYLDLADGSKEIAKKFFLDAFRGSPDMIEFILGPADNPTEEKSNGDQLSE